MRRAPEDELASEVTKKNKTQHEVRDLNKELVALYFTAVNGNDDKFKCSHCGKVRTQKPKTGLQNLVQHIKDGHEDWPQRLEASRTNLITNYFQADKKSLKIYGWLDFIISEGYCRSGLFLLSHC
jgi:hypothetical protein